MLEISWLSEKLLAYKEEVFWVQIVSRSVQAIAGRGPWTVRVTCAGVYRTVQNMQHWAQQVADIRIRRFGFQQQIYYLKRYCKLSPPPTLNFHQKGRYHKKTHIAVTNPSAWIKEGELVSFYAVKTYRGRRGVATLILNLDTRWSWVVNFMTRPFDPWERTTVPIEEGIGRTPKRV